MNRLETNELKERELLRPAIINLKIDLLTVLLSLRIENRSTLRNNYYELINIK